MSLLKTDRSFTLAELLELFAKFWRQFLQIKVLAAILSLEVLQVSLESHSIFKGNLVTLLIFIRFIYNTLNAGLQHLKSSNSLN